MDSVKDFQIGQKWLSRNGEVVEILSIINIEEDCYKIGAIVKGCRNTCTFTCFGEHVQGSISPLDLLTLTEDNQLELTDEQIATIFDDYRDIDDDINAVAFARKVIDAYKQHCK